MKEPTLLKSVFINEIEFKCIVSNQTNEVEYSGESYRSLWQLVEQVPELSNSLYLTQFAHLSNFFWKGVDFDYIESISAFQTHYLQQIELEKSFPGDIFPYRLTDYKIFDVSVMHEPLLEDQQLTYYVYNTQTGIPYRVSCPFPYTAQSNLVHYQILPLQILSEINQND